jgi:hypothetical protein
VLKTGGEGDDRGRKENKKENKKDEKEDREGRLKSQKK